MIIHVSGEYNGSVWSVQYNSELEAMSMTLDQQVAKAAEVIKATHAQLS